MLEVGLVLGGGGARGYAHIGVLKALEERGVKPVAIAACSMGGIVGALYGAGLDAEQLLQRAKNFQFTDMIDPGDSEAINRGHRLDKALKEGIPATFEELSIPLKITACDIQDGVQVVFDDGDLRAAIRATISLPASFRRPGSRAASFSTAAS